MDDKEQIRIFSVNLRYQISLTGKTQKEIAELVGTTKNSVNNWCNGVSMPKAGKIQTLADIFGIGKSQLLDDQSKITPELQLTEQEKELIRRFRQSPLQDAVLKLLNM